MVERGVNKGVRGSWTGKNVNGDRKTVVQELDYEQDTREIQNSQHSGLQHLWHSF
jgi:hypothetical protein